MEDKEHKEIENINKIEYSEQNNIITILNSIQHKPLIMEQIYSYTKNRSYILFHLISNDYVLKSSLKKIFDHAQNYNDLSKDLK